MISRMIDNAIDHIHVNAHRRKTLDRFHQMSREIRELNRIGTALSAEHDTDKLLELILTKAREITAATRARFICWKKPIRARTCWLLHKAMGRVACASCWRKTTACISRSARRSSMSTSARSRDTLRCGATPVNIPDAYALSAEVPYAVNRNFDEDSGYITQSILAVPMKNAKGEVVGVLQLINAKLERQRAPDLAPDASTSR